MADKANIVSYMDNAVTVITMKPFSSSKDEETWMDSDTTVEQRFKKSAVFSRQITKNGVERRLIKVSMPESKIINLISGSAILSDLERDFDISPYVVVPVPTGATDTDIANALRMLVNVIMGDEAAGTANAFLNASNQARDFLVHGFLPD